MLCPHHSVYISAASYNLNITQGQRWEDSCGQLDTSKHTTTPVSCCSVTSGHTL